jgi:quercetin dioxygenase-like cupin family protein
LRSISRTSAEHYTWGENCDGWRLVKNASLSIIEEEMPAGASEVRHYHRQSQQFFYILSGEAIVEIEGESHALGTGEGIHIAPNAAHLIRNGSEQPVRFLVISQPASHGDRIAAPSTE